MLQYNVIWLNGERIGTNIKQIYSLSKLATYKKAKATLQRTTKGSAFPSTEKTVHFNELHCLFLVLFQMRAWKGEVAMQTAWLESSMLFILIGVEKNTCEIKGGNKQKQTKKGPTSTGWWTLCALEKGSWWVCCAASLVLHWIPARLAPTLHEHKNHLVWFLAPAGSYHNATGVWSRSHRSAETLLALCLGQIQ